MSGRLRILLVVHDFQPGGAERVAIRLASRWARDGEQVAIACGSPAGELRSLKDDRVAVFEPPAPIRRSRFSRLSLGRFAAAAAKEFDADVIFLPGNFYAGMAAVLRLLLRSRRPVIVSKLSNTLRRTGRGRLSQLAFDASLALKTAFCDRIVVMDSSLLEEARRSLPWGKDKFSVMAQPVLDDPAPAAAASPAERPDVPRIVAAGRLSGQKNFAGLIDAAARVNPPFRLIIHGEGPDRARLEQRVADLGLVDRITLPGYVADLGPALEGARLFVLSSDFEGFPSVVVEALAAGVPVVATDCSPAIRGIIGDAEASEVVPVRDPDSLARAIGNSLARQRPDAALLAQRVERYRIGPAASAYIELFRSLVSGAK